jgi:hypothetical protein
MLRRFVPVSPVPLRALLSAFACTRRGRIDSLPIGSASAAQKKFLAIFFNALKFLRAIRKSCQQNSSRCVCLQLHLHSTAFIATVVYGRTRNTNRTTRRKHKWHMIWR